jgi:hypothetical protein
MARVDELWNTVNELEPECRDLEALESFDELTLSSPALVQIESFVPAQEI